LLGGLNDHTSATQTQIAAATTAQIVTLYGLGARYFEIGLLPSLVPVFTDSAVNINPVYQSLVPQLQAQFRDAVIGLSNWGTYYDNIIRNPSQYGITNTTDLCFNDSTLTQTCSTPETYFYYYPFHPSDAAHHIVGDALYQEALALATATGDPHFTTYDGVHYDYQGIGDFLLTRSKVDQFEVQVRTRSFYDDAAVTIMSQAAATLCNYKVTFDIDRASAGGFVWLDNSPISLSVGGSRSIGNGCEVLEISPNDYRLIWNTGEMLDVINQGTYLDLSSQLSWLDLLGPMEGLLSSEFDPDRWRVAGADSLFSPVPEPSSLTLLGVGIGLTGIVMMRRRAISSMPI
jgi:von Willebrand factor type D domain/PEP-CTERM motif